MEQALLAAVSSLLTALVILLMTQRHSRTEQSQLNHLTRVGRQLSELYGPMKAIVESSASSYAEFERQYGDYDGSLTVAATIETEETHPLTGKTLRGWKLWFSTVFQPNNRRIYELILSHGDLLFAGEMPQCAIDFCGHTSGCEVVLQRWAEDDYSQAFSLIAYPEAFTDYVRETYSRLQSQQQDLIGTKASR
jgi:hypothetical protein